MTEQELTELENEVAQRDDSNAMQSACGEYNCDCHYNLPKVIAALRAERLRVRQLKVLLDATVTAHHELDVRIQGFDNAT